MTTTKRLASFWRRRSLKFWLATGMSMALGPILVLAITGYVFYERTITRPLLQVSHKQRQVLQPLQQVQLGLWDMSRDVVDYTFRAGEGSRRPPRFDGLGRALTSISTALASDSVGSRAVQAAQRDWSRLSTQATALLSMNPVPATANQSQSVQQFEADVDRLGHDLGAIYEDLRRENAQLHDAVIRDLGLSEDLILGGFLLSVLSAIAGIVLINRSLVASSDRLLVGAQRVAAGERNCQINVQIPRELVNVAEAFNLMTERIRAQEEALEAAARIDDLTGLYNRREFDRVLVAEIQRGERYGTPVSLVLCDVDHFKQFNDKYGHPVGDRVLREIASCLSRELREVDRACRYGGEEFALVLPQCDMSAALQAAERVRQAVGVLDLVVDAGESVEVSVSLGVATYPVHGTAYATLFKQADDALYEAKAQGRNRVVAAAASPSVTE